MNQRGFTLVEIIIALTILSMLFIVISYIQARGAASYAATSQSVEVQESLRIALNKMSRELKGAEVGSIEISADVANETSQCHITLNQKAGIEADK
jgi:prepilin-type N-terminal cleavage/methylation domain-containing protein